MTIESALASLRAARPVLVVDDEERGAVVLAAQDVRTHWVAWTVRHTSGLLYCPMPAERADALHLPPMVPRNTAGDGLQHTVSVDARHGITTGISSTDRSRTFRLLASPTAKPSDLVRPGHVLPICTAAGRAPSALPEAAVQLCAQAGLAPVAVLATLVVDEGDLMPLQAVVDLGARHAVPVVRIAELFPRQVRGSAANV